MTSREELIRAAESMTSDEIHQHPLAARDKLRALARELRAVEQADTPTDDERVPGFAEREKRAARAWEFFARDDREMSHDFRGGYHQGMIDGFRRTVQGEPSVTVATKPAIDEVRKVLDYYADEIDVSIWQEIASAVDDIPDCETWTAAPHAEHVQGEPSDTTIPRYAMLDVWMALYGHENSQAFDGFYEGAGYAEAWATLQAAIRARAGEPQGEPTDAEIEAALEAAENAGPLTPIRERLRAALRAAAATQEGENR